MYKAAFTMICFSFPITAATMFGTMYHAHSTMELKQKDRSILSCNAFEHVMFQQLHKEYSLLTRKE